jgi:hypothetical protein
VLAGVGKAVSKFFYDIVNTYAKSEMAQKYNIAVIAAIAVLSFA